MAEIQTYLITITILVVIYLSFNRQRKTLLSRHRYFLSLIGLNIGILIIEIIRTLTTGLQEGFLFYVLVISNVLYFILSAIIISLWALYVNYHVFAHKKHFKLILSTLIVFVIINAALSMLSPFYGFIFTIDAMGIYHRGFLYEMVLSGSYVIMVLSIMYIVMFKHKLPKTDFGALIFFTVPPMVTAAIQIFVPEMKLLWSSMTVSLLILYIYIQSKITNTDPLTGVFNRREFDKQINYLSNLKTLKKKVCAIMIDIDDFKLINDEISHQMGDLALRELGSILKRSIRKDDFVARIGGDEFCIIMVTEHEAMLFDVINRIEYLVNAYNKRRKDDVSLSLSMGYGVYDEKFYPSFDVFFEKLDRKMYHKKFENKQKDLSIV